MLDNLLAAIEQDPENPFYQYGVAIEYRNQGDLENALKYFEQVYTKFPDYLANYYHFAEILLGEERIDEAKKVLHEGIELAQKQGNQHALSELQASLINLN